VAAISNSQANRSIKVAGLDIGLTYRALYRTGEQAQVPLADGHEYTVRRLGDQTHEELDLSQDERSEAEALRAAAEERSRQDARSRNLEPPRPPAVGRFIRQVRPPSRGLLVLYWLDPTPAELHGIEGVPGFLISFPDSPGAPTISYRVPRRYWERVAS
jgi:hypothetical protein